MDDIMLAENCKAEAVATRKHVDTETVGTEKLRAALLYERAGQHYMNAAQYDDAGEMFANASMFFSVGGCKEKAAEMSIRAARVFLKGKKGSGAAYPSYESGINLYIGLDKKGKAAECEEECADYMMTWCTEPKFISKYYDGAYEHYKSAGRHVYASICKKKGVKNILRLNK